MIRTRKFTGLYLSWIVLCAILFVALRSASDPSRRGGRIQPDAAGARAVGILTQRGIRGYEAVHVAYAKRGEGGPDDRWVVLCDQVPHTALKRALVVELEAGDGSLIGIREIREERSD